MATKRSIWPLECREVDSWGAAPEVGLQCAVVSLDLSLGLGVVGLAVLEGDPETGQFDLEAGVRAPIGGGVDCPVVAQHTGWEPVVGSGGKEDPDHVG
jgi:hypothetical protein